MWCGSIPCGVQYAVVYHAQIHGGVQGEGEESEKYERHDFEKPNPFVQEGEENEIASVAYR
jgi:hypothetical protein